MPKFKEFIDANKNNQRFLALKASPKDLAVKISGSLLSSSMSISESDSDKFSNKVVQLANSDEVLAELSDSIGQPKETESEDEWH